jgi:hypothetical protein
MKKERFKGSLLRPAGLHHRHAISVTMVPKKPGRQDSGFKVQVSQIPSYSLSPHGHLTSWNYI